MIRDIPGTYQVCIYLLTARLVAYRFLGYVLVLLQRFTRIYVLYSSTVLFFFVSAIETLIVVACHVLFVTTVWISENELRESINIIIIMLISAHVLVVTRA